MSIPNNILVLIFLSIVRHLLYRNCELVRNITVMIGLIHCGVYFLQVRAVLSKVIVEVCAVGHCLTDDSTVGAILIVLGSTAQALAYQAHLACSACTIGAGDGLGTT